jgi:hypothetical protein
MSTVRTTSIIRSAVFDYLSDNGCPIPIHDAMNIVDYTLYHVVLPSIPPDQRTPHRVAEAVARVAEERGADPRIVAAIRAKFFDQHGTPKAV